MMLTAQVVGGGYSSGGGDGDSGGVITGHGRWLF